MKNVDYYSECNDKGEYIKPKNKQKYDSLIKDKYGKKKWLEMTKYVNNVEQNDDYKSYLSIRDTEHALEPWELSGANITYIIIISFLILITLVVAIFLISLVSFVTKTIGNWHYGFAHTVQPGNDVTLQNFYNETKWYTFMQAVGGNIICPRSKFYCLK